MIRSMNRVLIGGLGILLVAGALAGLAIDAGPAMAHANYESSTPADGEVVDESPETVEVRFSQEMRRSGGLPTAIVVNESGDTISLETELSDEDRTLITIDLPPALPDGRYSVIWHNLSDEDGEEAQGAFHFYVGEGPGDGGSGGETPPPGNGETPAPTEPPSTPEPEPSDDGDDGVPVWGLIVAIAASVVVAGGAGVVIGRAQGG